jgi:putative redox protein
MRTVHVALNVADSRFVASGTHPGQTIQINAPKALGESRGPTGFSATELLLAATGACSAWDVVEIIRKRRQAVTALEVTVEGEQASDRPWQYEHITLHFRIQGPELRRGVVERVVRLSCVRYCSVLATVRAVARIHATIELLDEEGRSSGRRTVNLALDPSEPAFVRAEELVLSDPPTTEED